METKSFVRSSVAMTCVRVAPGEAFKRCCLGSGKLDGSARNYFFPRIETGSDSAPSFCVCLRLAGEAERMAGMKLLLAILALSMAVFLWMVFRR